VLEQPALAREAARIAHEPSVAADHAVARDRDRDRVAAIGVAHRARRARPADPPRDLAVARGGPERDLAQRSPHAVLEIAAARVERQCSERGGRAGEIARERGAGALEHPLRWRADGSGARRGRVRGLGADEADLARGERVGAERCVDRCGRERHANSSGAENGAQRRARSRISGIALAPAMSGTQQNDAFATSQMRGPGPARSQSSVSANCPFRKSAFHGDQSLWQMSSCGDGPTRRHVAPGDGAKRATRS